ncbi:MAG: AAA family ATPase [Deltaproteobacteria bacterium]|nr:AAA family ATPase [Deltaproteobacteria bacterium]
MCSLLEAGAGLVWLATLEEGRALALCQQAADRLGCTLLTWSEASGVAPDRPELTSPLAALDLLATARTPLLGVMLDLQDHLASSALRRRLRDLRPQLGAGQRHLVVVGPRCELPPGLAQEVAVLPLPPPGRDELEALLRLAGAASAVSAEAVHRAVLAATGLTALQAQRAFRRALVADDALGEHGLDIIAEEKRRQLALDVGLEFVEQREGAESMGGLESFKAWLRERGRAFDRAAEAFGLDRPRGVLLLGVQGCGKSLAAKCTARELGVPLLRLDLPRVLGAGGGGASAEENLARAIAAVEAMAPVALWIDEIEKAFAGALRSAAGDARTARVLGAFSTWLQEHRTPVFVVATANDVSALPPELLRRGRLDEMFFVDLPDPAARLEILSLHLRRRGRDPAQFDLASLVTQCQDFTGAELEQVVVGALHRVFALGRDLTDADLRRIAGDLVPLARVYEEQIKELREWAQQRARPAGREDAVVDLFRLAERAM